VSIQETIRVGIAGSCGRGRSFKTACDALGDVQIAAVCDINEKDLPASAERLGAKEMYTDYSVMLRKAKLDAVIIGTPMHLHVPQAVAALRRNIHVLSEVPAAVSIAECRKLVAACKRSRAVYMMAENYTYTRPNAIVSELAGKGLFGTTYYAEAAGRAGHGGGDYFEVLDFMDAVAGRRPPPIGIHEAMDMTIPGLVSQKSILRGGRWLDVPDSRDW
jgi:predicted dehydrogenase